MKIIAIILITLTLTSCASKQALYNKLKKEYGYTDEDIQLIKPHREKYIEMMSGSFAQSNEYDNSRFINARNRLNKIFCKCSKALNNQCIRPSKGVPQSELKIWAKGNAAFQVHKAMGNNMLLGTSGDLEFDPDEC